MATKKGGATSRAEKDVNQSELERVNEREEHKRIALAAIQKAGYLMGQVFEKLGGPAATVEIDDVVMLQAVASNVQGASARLLQAIKATQVQIAAADEKPAESASGLIIES